MIELFTTAFVTLAVIIDPPGCAPIYRPIRKIMPDFGGLDFSPLVILIAIQIVRMLLQGMAMEVAV